MILMIQYFHLFNRGVEKRTIFLSDKDRERFIQTIRLSRLVNSPKVSLFFKQLEVGRIKPDEDFESKWSPPWIEILAYCLMPNHFHFEVKELKEGGVSKFAQRLGNSYTLYFNIKHDRVGRLFESAYKCVRIETDEQLIHLSRYIHANPANSSKTNLTPKQLKTYPWSSLPSYLGEKSPICQPQEIMSFFKSTDNYWNSLKRGIGKEEAKLSPELLID